MKVVGRYAIFDEIASGGMASVHLARVLGAAGFARIVAVKQLRTHMLEDEEIRLMLVDEARLAARIHHPNVVQTLDVIGEERNVMLVMEYVHGEALSRLLRKDSTAADVSIACAIIAGVLHGLHAAHEALSDHGEPLGIVHRDVSPQNVLVGVDGVARVLDFGIAKAHHRLRTTRDGRIRGKLAYMAPEQIDGRVTRQTDVYATGIVLWELLTRRRLFSGADEAETMSKVLHAPVEPPSASAAQVPPALDAIVLRALERDTKARFETAQEMALAIEDAVPLAPASRVGAWVASVAGEALATRTEMVRAIERIEMITPSPPAPSARARPRTMTIVAVAVALMILVGVGLQVNRTHATDLPRPVMIDPPRTVPTPSTTTPAPSETTTPTHAPSEHAQTRRVTTASHTSPAASCDPPFRIGDGGVKMWIPGCL